jgi:hypothetical protein
MGINPSPETPHERTQQRIIYRRLQRLTQHGRFRYHTEYTILAKHAKRKKDWKPRVRTGAVYYSSLTLAHHERHQFEHKSLIAHIRGTLEGLEEFETLQTDTELRDAKAPLIYDLYGKLATVRLAVEANRSDTPKDVSKRCALWLRYIKSNDPLFPADRYVWVVETETKAWNIRQRWVEDGLTTGQLLVTWADKFTPYTPSSILEPIWLWGKNEELQSLRRNDDATDRA